MCMLPRTCGIPVGDCDLGFDPKAAHLKMCPIWNTVIDFRYPNGPFCFCDDLKCLLPMLWGLESEPKKAFGKKMLLTPFPKYQFSLLNSFHLAQLHSLGFCCFKIFFKWWWFVLFNYFLFWCLEGSFSIDIEGWWYIFMKEKSSWPSLTLTKTRLFHTASCAELCGACLTRLEQTASLFLLSLGLACLTISPIVILTRLSLDDGFFWPFSDKDNFLNFHFIWQQVVCERKEVLQWFMD